MTALDYVQAILEWTASAKNITPSKRWTDTPLQRHCYDTPTFQPSRQIPSNIKFHLPILKYVTILTLDTLGMLFELGFNSGPQEVGRALK